jgi:IMP dehydrogenase
MKTAYTYSDVLIEPQYSEVTTRKQVDLTSNMGCFELKLPIISANMKTITGVDMALEMYKNGGLGIIHRFYDIYRQCRDFQTIFGETNNNYACGMSLGVQDEDKRNFELLINQGVKIICLDVAHGHHKSTKNMLEYINNQLNGKREEYIIIAGNVATAEGYYDLSCWGADAVKVGIGGGSQCLTRKNTGVGVPQLYAIEQCYEERKRQGLKSKIISDGGIKSVGDIAKSLKFADAVMVGSFLAGTVECNGEVFKDTNGNYYKVYAGSASGENKISNGQSTNFIEGTVSQVPFRGRVKYILKEIKEGLQSAFSYVGAYSLSEFKNNCKFIQITEGSQRESKI